jgi:tetratricopeptide (TPR) repeat protein
MENWLTRIKGKWWLLSAARKRKRGEYAGALEILRKITKADPDCAVAFIWAGYCLSNLNRHQEAIDSYEHALQLVPHYGDAHAFLSLTYYALGRNQEALASFNRGVRFKPRLMDEEFWLYRLGLIARAGKEWGQSLQAFQKLTALNEKRGDAWYGVGWARSNLNQLTEAAAAYERVLHLDPKNAPAQSDLASVYLRSHRPKDALELLRRSIQLDPTNSLAHCNIGHAYCDLGKLDDALASVLQAVKLDPKSADGYHLLQYVYSELGRYDDAVLAAKAGIRLEPGNGELHCELL